MTGRRIAVLALVTALLMAGCGVPTSTGVRVDGPPEEPGAPGDTGAAAPPPGPDDADTPEQLVQYFLRAATGDLETAVEALRPFLHPDYQDAWQPEQVHVARIEDEPLLTPGDPDEFELTVQRIGLLNPDGTVEPRSGPVEEEKIPFYVTTVRFADDEVRSGDVRYRIVDPPNFILLDDEALASHFQARPIYFWDHNSNKLVPDLRWLPNSLPAHVRSQTALDWLFDSPSSWLARAVNEPPDGIEREGNVVWDGDSLEIPLTAPQEDFDLHALATQVWWTLRPDLAGGIEVTLVINGERTPLDGDYGASNPVPEDLPASFAIVDGTIVPYLPPGGDAQQVLEREEFNQRIERAAVSRNGRLAAVVRQQENGQRRLALAGPDGVTETDLTATQMSRPLWLNNAAGTGLVAADGRLRWFTSGEDAVPRLDLPPEVANITAVAAAPDGRRLALVADGRLYLASMVRTEEEIQINRPRWIPTTATGLEGVAFTRENRLAVIGAGEEQQELYELTVDGGREQRLAGLGSPDDISNVVAFPVHPGRDVADISIMYEADGLTWRYTRQVTVTVDAAELLDDPPEGATVRAPFFLD